MEPITDYSKGTFQYNKKTYHAHIEKGDTRIELKELKAQEQKRILNNAIAVFKKNISKQEEVKRAVFTIYNTHLSLEYFGGAEGKSVKQLPFNESPEAAKVDSYIRALVLNYDSKPLGKFEGVGLERKANEQTCYANTLLQLQFYLLGKDLKPYKKGIAAPDVENGREALWNAVWELQKEMRQAKKDKRSVGANSVMKVLQAATELKKAFNIHTATWSHPKMPNDLMELWVFINEQLPDLKAPHLETKHALYEDFYNGFAVTLQPDANSSFEALAQKKIEDAQATTLPKTLPFLVNRFDNEGNKVFIGVKLTPEIQLTAGNKTFKYELVAAAEHVGHSSTKDRKIINEGHYIAYTQTDKGDAFFQRNDAQVTAVSSEHVTQRLGVTGVLFFYQQKK